MDDDSDNDFSLTAAQFLPTSLTSLVIQEWTGAYRDYQQNSEVK